MPLTTFHLGPVLLLALLLFQFIDLPTFLIASVIMDIEPILVLVLDLDYPVHGFFHSFLGGSILAIILSLVMISLDKKIKKIMYFFRLKLKPSKRDMFFSSFLGIYLHIFLDSFFNTGMNPLFPLAGNPFYVGPLDVGIEVHSLFCTVSFLLLIVLFIYRFQNR